MGLFDRFKKKSIPDAAPPTPRFFCLTEVFVVSNIDLGPLAPYADNNSGFYMPYETLKEIYPAGTKVFETEYYIPWQAVSARYDGKHYYVQVDHHDIGRVAPKPSARMHEIETLYGFERINIFISGGNYKVISRRNDYSVDDTVDADEVDPSELLWVTSLCQDAYKARIEVSYNKPYS